MHPRCDTHEIVDFELQVCDVQPSVIGGAAREFIYSGRLDNLASSFCALRVGAKNMLRVQGLGFRV